MLKDNLSLETFITNKTRTLESDLMRFLLSDYVTIPLDTVLRDKGSPVDYADKILDVHRYDLYYLFFENAVKEYKVANYLIDGWIFDMITSVAVMLRVMQVRPDHLADIYELSAKANTFLLCLENDDIGETCLSGLSNFPSVVCDFINVHSQTFIEHDRLELFRVMTNMSEIDSPGWLFHNGTWRKLFLNHPQRLTLLRRFLHMSLVQYVITDEMMETYFGLQRSTLFTLMFDFNEIRESPRQSSKAILEFIDRLRINCDMLDENHFYRCIFEGPFDQFSRFHDTAYEVHNTAPAPKSEVRVHFKHNQP